MAYFRSNLASSAPGPTPTPSNYDVLLDWTRATIRNNDTGTFPVINLPANYISNYKTLYLMSVRRNGDSSSDVKYDADLYREYGIAYAKYMEEDNGDPEGTDRRMYQIDTADISSTSTHMYIPYLDWDFSNYNYYLQGDITDTTFQANNFSGNWRNIDLLIIGVRNNE